MKTTLALAIPAGLLLSLALAEPVAAQELSSASQKVTFGIRSVHRMAPQSMTLLPAGTNGQASADAVILLEGSTEGSERVTAGIQGSDPTRPERHLLVSSLPRQDPADRAGHGGLRRFEIAPDGMRGTQRVVFTVTE